MIFKNRKIFFLPILLLAACNQSSKDNNNQPADLFPQPKTVELNTDGGYKINTLTGDSIKPIILENGDTLITGIPIPTNGKVINPDSVSKPLVVKAGVPIVVQTNSNVHPIPENLTVIPVDENKLKRIKLGEGNKDFILVNSTGDTIQTGIPTHCTGKKVATKYPQAVIALPSRMKDNATCNIQYLDVVQGMKSSYVNTLIEDKEGNIWFGNDGGGASMYDGKSLTHFTQDEGLSNNSVLSILEDKKGNIWFGTYGGGVTRYDGNFFTHFTENEGFSNNFVRTILEDKNGNIWFGTYGAGSTMYDGNSFTHFTEKEGLPNNTILSIMEDKIGNIWFGTSGGGACRYDGKSFTHFTENDGLSNNYVLSIMEDNSESNRNGNIWFGTFGGGACMYDGNSFTHFTEDEGLSNNKVRTILKDKKGNVWFGTYDGGVSKYDGKFFTNITENEGLSNNIVRSILEDSNGNIWIGTFGGGANIYNPNSFSHFTKSEGLANNTVRSILEDKSGNIWFGTGGGGACKYDGSSFTHFTNNEGLSNNNVWTIMEDSNGNIWFGTYGDGVSMYDGKSFTHFTENQGLSNNYVWSIMEDKIGNIWFGTDGGGACKYDGNRIDAINNGKELTDKDRKDLKKLNGKLVKSFTHYTENEGLSNNTVYSILEDKNGIIWFCTNGGGVSKYDGNSFTHFTEKEGIANNYVWSIYETISGNIWFGTFSEGASLFDGKSFIHFTENEGLSNNCIWSILEDKSGNMWLSSDQGISLIVNENYLYGYSRVQSEKKNDKVKTLIDPLSNKIEENDFTLLKFSNGDGIKGFDFFANSVLLDSKNRIWWGSGKGLEMLDLNKFKISEKIPQPFLRQLDINENFVDYRNLSDSLKNVIVFDSIQAFENYPLNLVLPYTKNHLTFHFSGIDWAAPHKIKYVYKMQGLNENWSPPTSETKVDYRNLPYGTFTFKVCAIGESQIWSEPFEYTFTITPPWWHTWWFRGLMAFVFIIILFLLYRWRTAALRERQKVLEKTVEERTEELIQKNVIVEKQKAEVEKQKEHIEEAHKEITDSINYAERIQRSFLATKDLLDENLPNHFVFFQPKDVVSGDFYWAACAKASAADGHKEFFLLATADSTGHGVPGAIMSILNISSLEKAVEEKQLIEPAEILNHTRLKIIERLKKDGSKEGGKDGMDCSLISFDLKNNRLTYSAANNPVWIVRLNELLEFDADKMPVGKHDKDSIPFTQHVIDLQKGDVVYALTDGMPDQFGGPKGKKFMYKKLKELLISISQLPMNEQKEKLTTALNIWKGDLEQVDDVCIIGVRI